MKQLTKYNGATTLDTQPQNNSGKGWYFPVDGEKKMIYKYIILVF